MSECRQSRVKNLSQKLLKKHASNQELIVSEIVLYEFAFISKKLGEEKETIQRNLAFLSRYLLTINKSVHQRGLFKKLEQAIYHRKEIVIDYKAISKVEQRKVKPYKIVFMNENFYLACEVEHPNYQFSLFRISKIKSAEFTGKNFHQNREIASFIKDMQTPMAKYTPNYREHLIEILVEVDVSRARHFKAKKYLPSQKIVEEGEDGTLVLSFTVTQELEMADIVKRWIPHMRVITPVSLKDKIDKDLLEYSGNR